MSTQNINCGTVLKTLVRHYLKGSLAFSLKPEDAKEMTWDKQKLFLDVTIHSDLLKRFPVKNEYAQLFLKKLISFIEPYQEVHDDLYNYLCSVMKNSHLDTFCYRHYIIDDDIKNIITIRETNNMVLNGTTGMRTWEAALLLADWALCNKDIFLKKKVVELGSGVGFTAITIAKHCKIHSIVLSDCHNDVLKAINENIVINFPEAISVKENTEERQFKIDAMMLDWNDFDKIPNELVPDIVIGSDIVYDPAILQSLCDILQRFFERNDKLQVYIASMIRNIDTFKKFLETLENNKFKYDELLQESSKHIEWDYSNKQRCLLKIVKNK